jgi:hypothetical protein
LTAVCDFREGVRDATTANQTRTRRKRAYERHCGPLTPALSASADEDTTSLTTHEIATSQDEAALDVTADDIVKEWKDDLKNNPIGTFSFSDHTPPFSTLDIEQLSVKKGLRRRSDDAVGSPTTRT